MAVARHLGVRLMALRLIPAPSVSALGLTISALRMFFELLVGGLRAAAMHWQLALADASSDEDALAAGLPRASCCAWHTQCPRATGVL